MKVLNKNGAKPSAAPHKDALSLKGLSYTASNGTQILHEVDLDLLPGQVTAVLGPNGAGKSTLLRSLTGEYHPQRGSVTLGGSPLDEMKPNRRAHSIGVLPQASSLELRFSVLEVVLLGRIPHEATSSRMRDREIGMACLDLVDLAPFSERIYTTLSGGERQRVQLARVLAQLWEAAADPATPAFLLLDEPTSALDLSHTHSLLQLVQRISHEHNFGACVILHDLNLAAMYADQVEIMHHGKMVKSGAPRDVLTRELIRRVWGVETVISNHPTESCPLIVMGRTKNPTELEPEVEDTDSPLTLSKISETMVEALDDLKTPIDLFMNDRKSIKVNI